MHFNTKELRPNEIFLGNTSKIDAYPPAYLQGLKTIRLGELALDIHGKPLAKDYCRPIFIDKSEYDTYNRMMENEIRRIRRGQYDTRG